MSRARSFLRVVTAVAVAVLALSCSSGGDDAAESDSTRGTDVRGATSTTEGSRVVEDLPVSGETAECVDDQLGGGEVPVGEANDAVVGCQDEVVFSPRFAANLSEQYPAERVKLFETGCSGFSVLNRRPLRVG